MPAWASASADLSSFIPPPGRHRTRARSGRLEAGLVERLLPRRAGDQIAELLAERRVLRLIQGHDRVRRRALGGEDPRLVELNRLGSVHVLLVGGREQVARSATDRLL